MTGNISAVMFTVENVDETRVLVNITDPVTSIHVRGKQLTIRDILKKDLKYKISYYKSGSTGKVTCSITMTIYDNHNLHYLTYWYQTGFVFEVRVRAVYLALIFFPLRLCILILYEHKHFALSC